MGVQIRLQRHGSTHRPFYHLVATDKRNPRDGRFLEKLGYYDPNHNPSTIEIKADRIQHWYGLGAQVSPVVNKLLKVKEVKLERAKTHPTK